MFWSLFLGGCLYDFSNFRGQSRVLSAADSLLSLKVALARSSKCEIVLFITEKTDAQGDGCPCDFAQIRGQVTAQGRDLLLWSLFLGGCLYDFSNFRVQGIWCSGVCFWEDVSTIALISGINLECFV